MFVFYVEKKPDYVEDVDVSKLQLYVDPHHCIISDAVYTRTLCMSNTPDP